MKKMKKILAILLSMVMIIAMAVPAMADEKEKTAADYVNEKADVTVSNIADETTSLSAYKFLSASYDTEKGMVTYSLANWAEEAIKEYKGEDAQVTACWITDDDNNVTGVDVDKVIKALGGQFGLEKGQTINEEDSDDNDNSTATNILLAVIANAVGTKKPSPYRTLTVKKDEAGNWKDTDESNVGGFTTTTTDGKTTHTAKFAAMEVGSYVVLAKDTTNVYNSMQISVGLTADANGRLNGVQANNTVAKYTEVPFDKEIVQDNDPITDTTYGATDGKVKGDDYQVGDIVTYKLTNTIPNYDLKTYTDITYTITDTMSEGLEFQNDVVVKVNSVEAAKDKDYTVTSTKENGKTKITIDMKNLVKKDNLNQQVEITYSAKLTNNAVTGFDPNTNTATLTYTNNPSGGKHTITKTTNAYTFAIDGSILVNDKTNGEGYELKKTGVGEWTKTTYQEDTIASEYAALPNAYFTLYADKDEDGELEDTQDYTEVVSADTLKGSNPVASTEAGMITFEGLEGNKIYYLKETTAPTGYSLNDNIYAIEFVPEFGTNHDSETMTSYTVKVGVGTTVTAAKAAMKDLVTYTYNPAEKDENGDVTKKADVGVEYKQTTTITQNDTEVTIKTTEIRNTQLTSLPSTGGIGTTIFTVAGCVIMIAAAGMFMVSRRKRNA